MKRLISLMTAMLFLTGCNAVENSYQKWSIVDGKRVLMENNTTKYGAACVSIKTGMMIANVNDRFWVVVVNRDLTADPNSMKVILNGLANLETGGAAGVIGNF